MRYTVVAVAIAAFSLTAVHADTFVSSGDSQSDLTPNLQAKQPEGGSCMYAGQTMKLGDSITLTSIGITQVCVAGGHGPKLVVIAADGAGKTPSF